MSIDKKKVGIATAIAAGLGAVGTGGYFLGKDLNSSKTKTSNNQTKSDDPDLNQANQNQEEMAKLYRAYERIKADEAMDPNRFQSLPIKTLGDYPPSREG